MHKNHPHGGNPEIGLNLHGDDLGELAKMIQAHTALCHLSDMQVRGALELMQQRGCRIVKRAIGGGSREYGGGQRYGGGAGRGVKPRWKRSGSAVCPEGYDYRARSGVPAAALLIDHRMCLDWVASDLLPNCKGSKRGGI